MTSQYSTSQNEMLEVGGLFLNMFEREKNKILLDIGYALIMGHRPKASGRTYGDQWLSLCCCVSSNRS